MIKTFLRLGLVHCIVLMAGYYFAGAVGVGLYVSGLTLAALTILTRPKPRHATRRRQPRPSSPAAAPASAQEREVIDGLRGLGATAPKAVAAAREASRAMPQRPFEEVFKHAVHLVRTGAPTP